MQSVHPRSRGEHPRRRAPARFHSGSSPLARGTPVMAPVHVLHRRFIPARAGNTVHRKRLPARRPVHPRSRGEHRRPGFDARASAGSSPLARGTLISPKSGRTGQRFIPARAGNTVFERPSRPWPTVHPRSRGEHRPRQRILIDSIGSSPLARGTRRGRRGRTGLSTVHPRSRGEHSASWDLVYWDRGSSPLARGTLIAARHVEAAERFIPARAGNTTIHLAGIAVLAVHPRSRGEHIAGTCPEGQHGGSSPLARGTRYDARGHGPSIRFIPARAGNTRASPRPRTPATVHPRSRGEHDTTLGVTAHRYGSSPLARGTLQLNGSSGRVRRFIPARAGNTTPHPAPELARTVHPRSRGEHAVCCWPVSVVLGSSPLARGTLCGPLCTPSISRFIPARAGNTAKARLRRRRPPVHPRSRGEHLADWVVKCRRIGSSPLARGTRDDPQGSRSMPRFIPARAGNTPSSSVRAVPAPVHPRSRGEHEATPAVTCTAGGSSPLARGTQAPARQRQRQIRFIPARAGNTAA